jgi:signal transduction histidine kinase
MMNQRLRLADADGSLVADTLSVNPSGQLSPEDLPQAIPLQVSGRTVGYLLTEGGMVFSPGDEANLLSRLNRVVGTAGLIAVLFSLALALLLSNQLIKPIRALTQAASRLARGDLTQRVEVRGDDEISALARTFNQMAASLQQAETSRRAMTADIAHELRNPLAVQQAHLEAILDGIYPATPENITPILEQNRLLSRLVEDLRTLALADAGQLSLEKTPTDLQNLIERVADRFRPQATGQEIEIKVSPLQRCSPVPVDPGRMEQILGNLLSNALRFTPHGGHIEIALDCTPQWIHLSVRDSGPGIPEDALPHLFERFYRADRGRSREEGGSGLGLAIARQLARAHGGDLIAANHPQGGAIFTLRLPL